MVCAVVLAGCAGSADVPPATPTEAQALPPPAVASPTPAPTPLPSPSATPAEPTPEPTPAARFGAQSADLVQAYIDASYRVVAVAKNPFAPYTLIIATERSPAACGSPEDPERCTADETCGSMYTSPTCYFFVEPSFDAAAEPETRYVGHWPDFPTVSALQLDSLRFVDARTVEFVAAGGDGGYSVEELWWLDLATGALALQNRVENSVEIP